MTHCPPTKGDTYCDGCGLDAKYWEQLPTCPATDAARDLAAENAALREALWLRHGCEVGVLYGDDGEMQCPLCCLDFKRMPVDELLKRLGRRVVDRAHALLEGKDAADEALKEPSR